MTPGQRLKKLMQMKGMSPPALARAIGVSATTIRRYVRDETSPALDYLAQLAEALDVKPGAILGEEDVTNDERMILRTLRALKITYEEAIVRLMREPTHGTVWNVTKGEAPARPPDVARPRKPSAK